jgi:hypothetical protein
MMKKRLRHIFAKPENYLGEVNESKMEPSKNGEID